MKKCLASQIYGISKNPAFYYLVLYPSPFGERSEEFLEMPSCYPANPVPVFPLITILSRMGGF